MLHDCRGNPWWARRTLLPTRKTVMMMLITLTEMMRIERPAESSIMLRRRLPRTMTTQAVDHKVGVFKALALVSAHDKISAVVDTCVKICRRIASHPAFVWPLIRASLRCAVLCQGTGVSLAQKAQSILMTSLTLMVRSSQMTGRGSSSCFSHTGTPLQCISGAAHRPPSPSIEGNYHIPWRVCFIQEDIPESLASSRAVWPA